jgi:hypothetical protein
LIARSLVHNSSVRPAASFVQKRLAHVEQFEELKNVATGGSANGLKFPGRRGHLSGRVG